MALEQHVKQQIPSPPNAYILYRKERYYTVATANLGIYNNQIRGFYF